MKKSHRDSMSDCVKESSGRSSSIESVTVRTVDDDSPPSQPSIYTSSHQTRPPPLPYCKFKSRHRAHTTNTPPSCPTPTCPTPFTSVPVPASLPSCTALHRSTNTGPFPHSSPNTTPFKHHTPSRRKDPPLAPASSGTRLEARKPASGVRTSAADYPMRKSTGRALA